MGWFAAADGGIEATSLGAEGDGDGGQKWQGLGLGFLRLKMRVLREYRRCTKYKLKTMHLRLGVLTD